MKNLLVLMMLFVASCATSPKSTLPIREATPAEITILEGTLNNLPENRNSDSSTSDAARSGAQGTVIIQYSIKDNGTVTDAVILSLSGSSALGVNTLRAVKHWYFAPVTIDGYLIRRTNQKAAFIYTLGEKGCRDTKYPNGKFNVTLCTSSYRKPLRSTLH